MREFAVTFGIRKGLGPDFVNKTLFVGLDDLPEDLTDSEVQSIAVNQAEERFYKSEDYHLYGKNWYLRHVEET
jgi:hypothetical protein